eukprot:2105208-Amphidinium_carterae.1
MMLAGGFALRLPLGRCTLELAKLTIAKSDQEIQLEQSALRDFTHHMHAKQSLPIVELTNGSAMSE